MKLRKFLLSIFVFLIFVGFSYLVQKQYFASFDFDTTVKIQDKISHRFDILLSSLSLLGSLEISIVLLLVLLAIKRNLGFFILLPFSFFWLHLIELFGKLFVRHPGPPFMFFRYDISFLFPSSYVQPGYSYPSGHSTRTVFISVILLSFVLRSKMPKNLKLVITVVIALFDFAMLLSRVYLGEHWTTDVIGGSLLGLSLAIFTIAFL